MRTKEEGRADTHSIGHMLSCSLGVVCVRTRVVGLVGVFGTLSPPDVGGVSLCGAGMAVGGEFAVCACDESSVYRTWSGERPAVLAAGGSG